MHTEVQSCKEKLVLTIDNSNHTPQSQDDNKLSSLECFLFSPERKRRKRRKGEGRGERRIEREERQRGKGEEEEEGEGKDDKEEKGERGEKRQQKKRQREEEEKIEGQTEVSIEYSPLSHSLTVRQYPGSMR